MNRVNPLVHVPQTNALIKSMSANQKKITPLLTNPQKLAMGFGYDLNWFECNFYDLLLLFMNDWALKLSM